MDGTLRSPLLDIDLSALRHNLGLVRAMAGDREVIASIKANAYGFGVVAISRALAAAGVRKLWTGNFDEAVALRAAGIDAEILLFGGAEPHQYEVLLHHDLQPTVFDHAGASGLAAAAAAAGKEAPVWIKVDAGLGRLGVPVEEAFAFVRDVAAMPGLALRGVYSHLPFGSVDGRQWALDRQRAFQRLIARLAEAGIAVPVTQLWGSSGLLAGLPDDCNAVCVGHALYGLSPLEPGVGDDQGLRPLVRSLSAGIIRINDVKGSEGGSGGYGRIDNRLAATAAIGIGDGLRKAMDGAEAQVIVNGRRVPVKAFTLEHLMLDISDTARPELFDRITLIGEAGEVRISLDDWARWTKSSPLEVMISLSDKTPVRYSGETAD